MNVTLTHSDHALTLSGADATTLALGTNAVTGHLGIHNAGILTLYEAGDTQNVTLQCNDAEAVATLTGGLDITGEVSISSNTVISGTKKLYLDGGGNTYLVESAGDVFDLYVGGVKAISITENTTAPVTFNDAIVVGTSIELGHASDTTLARVSAGVVSIEGKNIYVAGGADVGPADGGTGVSNGANNTITFTGNYTLGLTLSNNTSVTLPTSGTLLANVAEDTTPQLGGELDCQAHSIGFTQQTATGDGTTTID